MKPSVSVILCVRNGATTILRQLHALDAQIDPPDHEIIICDNGSTDGTAQVIRTWMDTAHHSASAIRLLDGGRTPSLPRSQNLGVTAAKGVIVAICDADDEVRPEWLRALTAAVPVGGIVGGRVNSVYPDGTPDPYSTPGLRSYQSRPFASGGNMATRRDLLIEIGGYDESFPCYGFEDVDLSWRTQLTGHHIAFCSEAAISATRTTGNGALRKRFLLGQGTILMAHRYPGYDPHTYTIVSCSKDVTQALLWLAYSLCRLWSFPARKSAGQLVKRVGTLYGYLTYQVFGHFPEPQLITPFTAYPTK